MSQNIYDNASFFAEYSALDRSVKGLDGAPEWPRLRSYIPDLAGLDVLDLGCGFGWFSRWARSAGAKSVRAIEISENMLTRARTMTDDTAIVYEQGDLDSIELSEDVGENMMWCLVHWHFITLQIYLSSFDKSTLFSSQETHLRSQSSIPHTRRQSKPSSSLMRSQDENIGRLIVIRKKA
jgi:SAM-dependent methyltransferase